MTTNGWLQIAIFFLLILGCAKPLGSYIARIIEGKRSFLSPVLGPVERLIYRICGVALDDNGEPEEQHWTRYAAPCSHSAHSAPFYCMRSRDCNSGFRSTRKATEPAM